VHYIDDNKDGHKGEFARTMKQLGFAPPLATELNADTQLIGYLKNLLKHDLPEYPHQKLNPNDSSIKKQKTRMIKVECQSCEFLFRASKKQTDRLTNFSLCPVCSDNTLKIDP
jgi:hypothetical protein